MYPNPQMIDPRRLDRIRSTVEDLFAYFRICSDGSAIEAARLFGNEFGCSVSCTTIQTGVVVALAINKQFPQRRLCAGAFDKLDALLGICCLIIDDRSDVFYPGNESHRFVSLPTQAALRDSYQKWIGAESTESIDRDEQVDIERKNVPAASDDGLQKIIASNASPAQTPDAVDRTFQPGRGTHRSIQAMIDRVLEPQRRMQQTMQAIIDQVVEPHRRMRQTMQEIVDRVVEPHRRMQQTMQEIVDRVVEPHRRMRQMLARSVHCADLMN